MFHHLLIAMERQTDLLQIILALQPRRRLAHLLDGGHEQRDQNRDDGDDDEQFDEREGGAAGHR